MILRNRIFSHFGGRNLRTAHRMTASTAAISSQKNGRIRPARKWESIGAF